MTPADGKADDGTPHTTNTDRDTDEITQEEKPRSRILAEYLAHGYVVGDATLQRAIELDTKHGVTNRFMNTLMNLDQKYHATERAKATDQSYGITNRANSLFSGISSYFEKATSSPTGKKLVKFYTEGQRQVQDIHAEARRLADLKKEEHGGSAYKASGLERVFGKEKPTQPGDASAPTDSCKSIQYIPFLTQWRISSQDVVKSCTYFKTYTNGFYLAAVPPPGPKAGTTESTPLATTGAIPSKAPGDEKA